jgi:hypothetical protein
VVTVVILPAVHAVIHGFGIGEAVRGVAAMAEGHDRRWYHQAKRGKNRDHYRQAEAKPGAECPHAFEPSGGSRALQARHQSKNALPTAQYRHIWSTKPRA